MAASDVENAHNERPKINTCWCIQIKEPYPFGYLLVMAIYPSCRNKLTLEGFEADDLPDFSQGF